MSGFQFGSNQFVKVEDEEAMFKEVDEDIKKGTFQLNVNQPNNFQQNSVGSTQFTTMKSEKPTLLEQKVSNVQATAKLKKWAEEEEDDEPKTKTKSTGTQVSQIKTFGSVDGLKNIKKPTSSQDLKGIFSKKPDTGTIVQKSIVDQSQVNFDSAKDEEKNFFDPRPLPLGIQKDADQGLKFQYVPKFDDPFPSGPLKLKNFRKIDKSKKLAQKTEPRFSTPSEGENQGAQKGKTFLLREMNIQYASSDEKTKSRSFTINQ